MSEFIEIALSLPTVLYSIVLAVVVLYWLLVLVGAFEIDFLDSVLGLEGADGAADGLVDGALEGGTEGLADAGAEGFADGAAEALDGAAEGVDALDGADGADGAEGVTGGDSGLLAFFMMRGVPLTVSLSVMTVFGWLSTFAASFYVLGGLDGSTAMAATIAAPMLAALICLPITAVLVRPLRGVFSKGPTKRGQETLIGKIVKVSTGRVDDRFGQATFDDKGAGLTLSVRADKDSTLSRGDRALIIGYDKSKNVYQVEPYDALLGTDDNKNRSLAEEIEQLATTEPAPVETEKTPSRS